MKTRVAVFAAIGCVLGAASGWYFGQVPAEAMLGIAAGTLIGATIKSSGERPR